MKVIQINTVCNGSTGKIMGAIERRVLDDGNEALAIYGRRKGYVAMPCVKCGNGISFWTHVVINTLFDLQGYGSIYATQKMIKILKNENPDVIHLHNLHGYYLNLRILFDYLANEYKGKVVWTFHDLWPITGHCPHFVMAKCDKWKTECNRCPNKRRYPISFGLDMSRHNYWNKKKLFNSLNDLSIICPSKWMADRVKESFLSSKCINIINNGIDMSVFNFSKKLTDINGISIEGKSVILGVSNIWEKAKGLEVFIELYKCLDDNYQIVLVGLNESQISRMPSGIIAMTRTDNQQKLVDIYSTADVLVNPSVEESFSLVTIEAMACGTPVIALDTSAVKELVNDYNGIVLHNPDIVDYKEAVNSVIEDKKDRQMVRSSVCQYTVDNMTKRVINLYMHDTTAEK